MIGKPLRVTTKPVRDRAVSGSCCSLAFQEPLKSAEICVGCKIQLHRFLPFFLFRKEGVAQGDPLEMFAIQIATTTRQEEVIAEGANTTHYSKISR